MAKTQPDSGIDTQNFDQVSIDSNLIDPASDRLGYAPFAQHLAESICQMSFGGSFVIAVHGSWNFGKSTLLNFIVHYLKQKPENEQPIIIPFNPWLFSGDEDISKRFFDQIQSVLNQSKIVPKGLKARIADFAKVVSDIPLPYAQAGNAVATLFDDKQKDASDFKEDVETTLLQKHPRIVVTIDDVDRLDTEEIKKLFRVIKAFPNFTDVVYLLFYDKEIIIKALAQPEGITGEAYLDKIVQLSFDLPVPNKTLLRRLILERLGFVLNDTPKHLFDQTRWAKIYFQGIDHFLTNQADIYRLINNLSVTYPAVKGKVNSVDFIAIESLRVFCPTIYDIIRKNPQAFTEQADEKGLLGFKIEELKRLHNSWIIQVKESDREPVKQLLLHLFPKLESVWDNTNKVTQPDLTYRNQLRICSLEIFPDYFRLALPEGELSTEEMQLILTWVEDAKVFGENLVELANQKSPDGTTQVRSFLERFEDYTQQEIPLDYIPSIVQALFNVGDRLLRPEDEPTGMFDFGNDIRISRILEQLLHRLDELARFELLKHAMTNSKAISIIVLQVIALGQQQGKYGAEQPSPEQEWLISAKQLKKLEQLALKKVQDAAQKNSLLQLPKLPHILDFWRELTSEEEVKQWVQEAINNDEGLLNFLEKFLQKHSNQHTSGIAQTEDNKLESYLNPSSVIHQLKNIVENSELTKNQAATINQYIQQYDTK